MVRTISSLVVGLLLSSCASDLGVSQPTKERLALCGAGYEFNLSADLEAKIEKNIETPGVSASAGLADQLKTEILAKIPETDALAFYDKYVSCIDNIQI